MKISTRRSKTLAFRWQNPARSKVVANIKIISHYLQAHWMFITVRKRNH